MKKFKKILPVILILSIIFTGCVNNSKEEKIIKGSYFFLNSILNIKIYDNIKEEEKNKIYDNIEKEVSRLESLMTDKDENSEVSKINQNSGIKPVKVSREVFDVIKRSLYFSKLSNGDFDITVGKLTKLWDIGEDDQKLPTKEEIQDALKYVDYKKIKIDEENQTVYLEKKGMMIDLGGIAKGYVADKINSILSESNINSAIINLGGNVYLHGKKENNKPFKVAIRDPFSKNPSDYMMIYKGKNETVVTSGIYERYFEKDGKRYHHILSTKDGYPVQNNLMSTTIITKNSMDADALSTIVFVQGIEKGYDLTKNLNNNTHVMFITKDKQVYLDKNIMDNSEITNDKFKIKKVFDK